MRGKKTIAMMKKLKNCFKQPIKLLRLITEKN